MRCWAEINTQNLRENMKELEKIVPRNKIIAVVKADAYGHGMIKVCETLMKEGIENFAVATVEEALSIIELDYKANILILGPIENKYMNSISAKNIYFMVTDFEEIEYIEKNKCNVTVFIKVDTGMGRVGFQENETENWR